MRLRWEIQPDFMEASRPFLNMESFKDFKQESEMNRLYFRKLWSQMEKRLS